jgi:hypothetical protein
MINNARELINKEGFGTLHGLGRKFNNFSAYTVWVGLRPTAETTLRPVWHDEPEAKNEKTLDLSWESVELVGFNETKDEETEPIVLRFPFEYSAFQDAIYDVIQYTAKL